MASIYDVAKAANVSPSTVSRIINGRRNVAPATAAAVEAAMVKVGYRTRAVRPGPRPVGRTGVTTGIVDFLSVGHLSPAELLGRPFFSKLLDELARGVEREGMDLVLSYSRNGDEIPPVLARRRVDGAVLFGDAALYPKMAKALERIPVVWCFVTGTEMPPDMSHVLYNNQPVGAIAAEYLLRQGHERTAVLSASPWHHAFTVRRDTFCRVIRESGRTVDVIEGGDLSRQMDVALRARPLIDRVVAMNPRPTGVFCVSDDLMLAVFNGLHQRGVESGRDIELIGCNNDRLFMEQMHPRPATINLKLDQVGRQAFELLLTKMSNPLDSSTTGFVVTPSLMPAEEMSMD